MSKPYFYRELKIFNSSEIPLLNSNRIYLVGSKDKTIPLGSSLGLRTDENGAYFERSDNIDLAKLSSSMVADVRVPNIARPVRRAFIGDLIPATSWGSSLANILTKSCWDRVKELPISYAGNVCLMCGYFSENRRRDAHELWGYKDPMQEGTFGKQTLKALMPLCTDCHETFHLGFANVQGRLDIVLRYYRSLTGPSFTAKDIDDYYRWIGDRWTLRSNFFWGLDVSIISDRFTKIDPLILKKEWVLQDTKIIISEEKDSQTVFAGVHWKNAGADTQVNYLPASELD